MESFRVHDFCVSESFYQDDFRLILQCRLIQGIFRCSGLTKKPNKLTILVNFKTDQSESAG